jgi:hypothetical protein
MGFPDKVRIDALAALGDIGIVQRIQSSPSEEHIIYNVYVWGSGVVPFAHFLASLPTDERKILTSLSASVIHQPGISLSHFRDVDPSVISAARKVGFLDATRVVTRNRNEASFAFSPTLESSLPDTSTDVLHERKLFVAHILFGHRNAPPRYGRIDDPLALVRALLRNGAVGPTTAIDTDYLLLESHGIVKVIPSSISRRSYLSLVKQDVVEESLPLLVAALGDTSETIASQSISALWLPGSFKGPEDDRRHIRAPLEAGAELFSSVIKRLREEVHIWLAGRANLFPLAPAASSTAATP